MIKYNISKPEKYMKDGVEKTFWANVGTITEFKKDDGSVSRILEIPAISLKAHVFPVEPVKPKLVVDEHTGIEYPESINPNDIPF